MIQEAIRQMVREANGDEIAVARRFGVWIRAGGPERLDAFLDEMETLAGATPIMDNSRGSCSVASPNSTTS